MNAEQLYHVPEIEELAAGLQDGASQDSPTENDPIQATLDDSGLGALQQGASMATVEAAVRNLVACLAGADDIRRATVREAALKKLGEIGISAPGRLIDAALQRQTGSQNETAQLFFTDPEPWPAEVDGAELLDEIAGLIRRYVVLPNEAAHAVALWILHAWALEAFDISALLAIVSALKRCAKTTLLEIIGMLVPRSLSASNITPAALFRAVEKFKPVLLIDEADTFLAGNDELRGVLNAGHRRSSAFVIRTVGDEHEPKQFCTWGAKAIALIGKLPGTLEDRSIVISMRRRAPHEHIERFRTRTCEEVAKPLRSRAFRWASDATPLLRSMEVETPAELNDRAADNWHPLFVIAKYCGGKWPERARSAALALSQEVDEAENSALIDLLREFKELFESRDKITSADLVEHLGSQVDKRWAEWRRGKPITQRQVARLLASLKIKPGTIRISREETPKGYLKNWFDDAFSRYLPDLIRHDATTQENQLDTSEIDPPQKGHVADRKDSLSIGNNGDVADVADEKGVAWECIG